VTKSIHDLYEVALKEKDYAAQVLLQWFINEQVEEENTANSILDKMKLAGDDKSGLFLIDKELGGMAGPVAAVAVAT